MDDSRITRALLVDEPPAAERPPARSVSRQEESACRLLEARELPAARRAVEALLQEAFTIGLGDSVASYFLYEILCRADAIVSAHAGLPPRGLQDRLAWVRALAAAGSRDDLAAVFWSCYDSLIPAPAPPAAHPAVAQVRDLIRKHYRRKLTLSEIARTVGISRNYLSHLFKRQSGVTITEFVHRARLEEARALLEDGRATVTQIARQVGYQNYRDFHRNFVKYRKVSPKRYRQSHKATRPAHP